MTEWFPPRPLRRYLAAGLAALAMLYPGQASTGADHAQHRQSTAQLPAPGYRPLGFPAPEPGSYTLPVLGEAAEGVLLDSDGTHQSLHELFRNRVIVLSFIYTSCGDVNGCPLATHVLGRVQQRIAREAGLREAVRLISISFDPAHDTPAVMRKYHAAFAQPGVDWRFLTAESQAQLAPLLEAYGQSLRKDYDGQGNFTGSFSHILRVFLIDRAALIRNIYSVSFLHADTVISDIETLLLSEAGTDTAATANHGLRSPGDERNGYAAAAYQTHPRSQVQRRGKPADLLQYVETPPLGLPPVPTVEANPVTRPRVELGRKLFYDRRLSHNNTISCAMCHVPQQGFTVNEMATAVGIEGRSMRRNAPTLYNVAYATHIFHDGRETQLEQQVWGPLLAANEMGNPSVGYVLGRIRESPDYAGLFEAAFDGRGPGMETLGMALAAYERTLISANSSFDRWYFGEQSEAIPPAARRGFALFIGRGGCSGCHTVGTGQALFTDNELHNTGIGYAASFAVPEAATVPVPPGESVTLPVSGNDLGRYEVTLDPADRWKFKTPTLRNIALTAPYMHDGSIGSLREVVEFYNRGGVDNPNLDPRIRALGLTAAEMDDLVAFLVTLTGDNVDVIVGDAFAAPIGDP